MSHTEEISGNLVDLFNETIYPAVLIVVDGRIAAIRHSQKVDSGFIIPGFVDAHVHIESSMLPPSEFARLATVHGTVATVSDPHEIGNVMGVAGVEYMLDNAATVPLKFHFGAPSCVPATSFETSGAHLGPAEIETLLSKKEIKYLSEVMNFPGVIHRDAEVMAKIAIAKRLHKRIDGHAPGVRGDDLKKYISAGIQTDHECTTYAEAKEKCELGMKILVREGSAARNFDALFPLMLERPDRCMLCCDDTHPDSLLEGHINRLVQRAVSRGMDVMNVLRCASWNAIEHYGLDVGMLRVNDPADFIRVKDLKDFEILSTYIDGKCVARNGKALFPHKAAPLINHFKAHPKRSQDFQVAAKPGKLKVIEAIEGELITRQAEVQPLVKNGLVEADPVRDILKIAVVNRYMDVSPSVAFIKNFGLKRGAIASSVAHDSHNIVAVGVTDEDLCNAVNAVIASKGGVVVVDGAKIECLSLPIAGLMSDREGVEVAQRYKKLEMMAQELGSSLAAPFMTLSFMALLVIPQLKISDKGLFDTNTFAFTPLQG
jgi:adenine deaminase